MIAGKGYELVSVADAEPVERKPSTIRAVQLFFLNTLSPRFLIRWFLYIYLVGLMIHAHVAHPTTAVKSMEDFYNLPTSASWFAHPGIHTVRQFAPDFLRTQRERQDAMKRVLKATFAAYYAIGLPAFLDSGFLLGYQRTGDVIPWDEDADIAFDTPECLRLFPNPGDFQRAMEENIDTELYYLLGIDCVGAWKVDLGHLVLAGKIIEKKTGYYVDQFSYHTVPGGIYQRVIKASQVPYPVDVVFPLKEISWLGSSFKIPNDTKRYLEIQYEGDTGIPIKWMWRLVCTLSWFIWWPIYALGILSLDPMFGLIIIAAKKLFYAGFQFQILFRAIVACCLGIMHRRALIFGLLVLALLMVDQYQLFLGVGARKAITMSSFINKKPGYSWIV